MTALKFQPGDIVSGIDPSELVEIKSITPFGNKLLIQGISVQSRREIKRPVTEEELTFFTKVRGEGYSLDGDSDAFLLGAEAERIRIAHQFDPLFAVNSSIVDPLPHQVEAVYQYLLPLPRIRFLLADDTGAGKTIMTGLLIKELLFRGVIQKILIITPGGLPKQWQEELDEKFGLYSRLVNRATFNSEPDLFSRNDEGIFIVSIDFLARNENCQKTAGSTQWDLVVVDEAHKLSAYEYGRKLDKSGRYKAVESVAYKTDHLLFLTATPHRGRKDTFRRLLLLLDEDIFQKDEHVSMRVQEEIAAYGDTSEEFEGEASITKARNRFFLRRLKEEMVDWDGKPLFKERHTRTVGYDLTPEEQELYEQVTRYVRTKRKEAKAKKNRNVELTLMVMQRRLASSIYAITRTLHKRFIALEEVLAVLNDPKRSEFEKKRILSNPLDNTDPDNYSDLENLSEEERDRVEDLIFRQVLTDDPEKIEEERDEVERLYNLADDLKNHNEAKFTELLSVLDSSDVIRDEDGRLLIFTEHKDTMDSLTKRLEDKGYIVENIHGGMDVDARKVAQRNFRIKAKIMVATDAAGEGINLQFCRYMINWDIPWNPNRLEQRMGRIHRYGQTGDVWVYNLVAQNTREGAVLERVLRKLDVMREQMGSDRVYDVIDELLQDVPLAQLLEDAIDADDSSQAFKNTENVLNTASEGKAEALIKLQKKTSLTSRLNLRAARDLKDSSDERRLQPLFIQRFFERVWVACNGDIRENRHFPVWDIGRTPSDILAIAQQIRASIEEKYKTPFVFDKKYLSVASTISIPENTKLMGPGNVLFDTLIEWAVRSAQESFTRGAVLLDPNISDQHYIWLLRSKIQDGRNDQKKRLAHEKLVVVIHDKDGFRITSPSYMLNCLPPDDEYSASHPSEKTADDVQMWGYETITEKQLEDVKQDRRNECDLREQYLNSAFTDLILELQGELNDLHEAQLRGESNREEQERLRKRIEELKIRKEKRLDELELMMKLTADLPEVITHAVVLPVHEAVIEEEWSHGGGVPMRRDDEVEQIAMSVAMEYERDRGWTPFDVSRDGEHYDVRSESKNGEKRYIEVKGRAHSGDIVLTGPELDKLAQLGDRAWLYIVTSCRDETPRLNIIQDPINKLTAEMLYRQIQFLVNESDWQNKSDVANI